jgi:iron complex outermembrane receptor protein
MFRDCLLASTMIAGAAIALPAYAQTTPAPAPQGATSDDAAASTTPALSNTLLPVRLAAVTSSSPGRVFRIRT